MSSGKISPDPKLGGSALVVVDIQNDFLPGGTLAVPNGDAVIPVINRLQSEFPLVAATKDWHPANHGSFASNHPGRAVFDQIDLDGLRQILWPVHCVQGTHGAEFASSLNTDRFAQIFLKGVDANVDSYSALFDNAHRRATGLHLFLQSSRISDIYICGLATDYCVKFTALDAIQLGLRTHIIEDACRGVNLNPDDSENALEEIKNRGAMIMQSQQLV